MIFERMTPGSPKRFDETFKESFQPQLHQRTPRGSADVFNYIHNAHHTRDGTPDSPISQVSRAPQKLFSFSQFNLFLHILRIFPILSLNLINFHNY